MAVEASGDGRALTPGKLPNISLPAVIAIGLMIAGAIIGMSSVFGWIFTTWWSFAGVGVYSHGYLVLALSLWMGWTFWQRDPPGRLAPNWWALVPLVGLVLALALMELVFINSSRALLVPLMFIAATGLAFGLQVVRPLLFPALFIYFGLLPWWILNGPLQAAATRVVEFALDAGGIPAYIEGNFIHLSVGVFEVASACSGLSFFLSALTLAVFYGAMYLRRWPHRAVLLVAAAAAAIFSNWIRVWTLVLVGYYTDMEHWLVGEHYFYGWVLFVIALAPVLYFARWLEDREYAAGDGGNPDAEGPPGNVASPSSAASAPGRTIVAAAFAGALLLALPRVFVSDGVAADPRAPALPQWSHPALSALDVADRRWAPSFDNAGETRARYEWQGRPLDVYVAAYTAQSRHSHLFLSANTLTGRGWQSSGRQVLETTRNGEAIQVIELRGRLRGDETLVWAWYEVAGTGVTSRLGAKLAEVAAIPDGRNDGTVFALRMECGADCDPVRGKLEDFMHNFGSSLQFEALQPAEH